MEISTRRSEILVTLPIYFLAFRFWDRKDTYYLMKILSYCIAKKVFWVTITGARTAMSPKSCEEKSDDHRPDGDFKRSDLWIEPHVS